MDRISQTFYDDNCILLRAAIVDGSRFLPPNPFNPRNMFEVDVIDMNHNGRADAVTTPTSTPDDTTWVYNEPSLNVPYHHIKSKAREKEIHVVTGNNYQSLNLVDLRIGNVEVRCIAAPNSFKKTKKPTTALQEPSAPGTELFSMKTEWGIDVDTNEYIIFCSKDEMRAQAEKIKEKITPHDSTMVTEEEVIIGDVSLPIRA